MRRYHDDCHADAYLIDAQDHGRLIDSWDVFGMRRLLLSCLYLRFGPIITQDLNVSLFLFANKQCSPRSFTAMQPCMTTSEMRRAQGSGLVRMRMRRWKKASDDSELGCYRRVSA